MDNPAFLLVNHQDCVGLCPPACMAWPSRRTKRTRKVHWVFLGDGHSFVSLGLLVTFACRSGLNNRGGVSGVHAAGGTTSSNHTLKYNNKYRDARAQTFKCIITKETNKYNPKCNNKYKCAFSKMREIPIRPKIHTAGDVRATFAKIVFFARVPVCASWTRSELRDKTMIGHSKWSRMLGLDSFRGMPEKRLPATENCVCSVTRQKKKTTASLTSGNVCEHAAARVGSVRSQNMCTHRRRLKKCSPRLVL